MTNFQDQKTCSSCNKSFHFLTAFKYPCGACGRAYCKNCLPNQMTLIPEQLILEAKENSKKDFSKVHRCCNECSIRIKTASAQGNTFKNTNSAEKSEKMVQNPVSSLPVSVELPRDVSQLYQFGDKLGEGGYAVVKSAIRKSDQLRVAVKIVNRKSLTKEDEAGITQEVDILKSIDNPNIVKLYDFHIEPGYFYVVMECIEGGELFDRIVKKTSYNEKEARDLAIILLKAIKYMHDRHIVHRDLKPENLLLTSAEDDADVKIVDFGFAVRASDLSITEKVGTPAYMAPEILHRMPYGKPVDMWSFGVILYILLGGYPPFYDGDQKMLYKKIMKGVYQFHTEYWGNISNEAKDLIRSLLILNPYNRLTVDQALNHNWIVKTKDDALANNNLQSGLKELKKFMAKRKLRAGIKAIIAVNKFKRFSVKSTPTNVVREPQVERELEIPHSLEARYDLGKVLGQGGYSVVKLGTSKISNETVAVKILDRKSMDKAHQEALRVEVAIMQSLNHPHIVKALDFFEEKDYFYVVMELITGGELFDRIVKKTCYSEREARDLAKTFLQTLKYLHDREIVHRDLKPENLLLTSEVDDSDIKIVDFGFAAHVKGENLTEHCGTPGYIAPEILRDEKYGKTVDMWSFGIILYILLGGYPPFYDKNTQLLYKKIMKGAYEFHTEYWTEVSDEAKDLIAKLLVVDQHKRLTVDQALAHSWIIQKDEVLNGRVLNRSLTELRKFQAKRKFRVGIKAIISVNRMKKLVQWSSKAEAECFRIVEETEADSQDS